MDDGMSEEESMGRLRFKRKRLVCHKCNREKGGKHYLLYKDGYSWVCPECGYQKEIKAWHGAHV